MRENVCVGASVASMAASAVRFSDTPTRRIYYFLFFCRYPTLCVWGKHSAWMSTAEIGGDHFAHNFGQKPEPTYLFFAKRKGKPKETKTNKRYFLGRGEFLGRTQTETITLRVTPEEKMALQERMYKAIAPSMRQFVMDMCMSGQIIVNSDLRELNRELRYQGNNLNQLTRLSHQGRATVIDLGELLTVYRKILLTLGGDASGNR